MNENKSIYEIGFHISPSLSGEEVELSTSSIKNAIVKNGGNIIGEESPKIANLSYPIVKRSDIGAKSFPKAFFGWIKFEVEGENVSKVNDFAKLEKNILRFILIKTDKANIVTFHKNNQQVSKEENSKSQEKIPTEIKEIKNVSEEEIDETIDSLIVT